MADNLYEGCRKATFAVTKNGEPLDPARSRKVKDDSVGFSWAYNGQGPNQLALAILLEETDEATALKFQAAFRQEVVANLDQSKPWSLTSARVREWLAARGVG